MEKRPFYRKVRQTLHETVSDSGKSILCYRGNNDKIHYVASCDDPNIGPGGGMIEVTWQELKNKRDAGELIPGCLYRITDYQCTTTQENTQSAGHQFDIVLLALSENKLAEEGWAMEHPTDIYDVTFHDGVTIKCYLCENSDENVNIVRISDLLGFDSGEAFEDWEQSSLIDYNNKTLTFNTATSNEVDWVTNIQYNYFQNSNLSAWKVWYCLDNDTARFAWAMDGTGVIILWGEEFIRKKEGDVSTYNLVAWYNENNGYIYTKNENPQKGDTIYGSEGEESESDVVEGIIIGRGVIYRLIDEFNNDIKYDFKNIQFKRTIIDGQYDAKGDETWCYTLNVWYNNSCNDASVIGNTLLNDEGYITGVYDNKFGYATAYDLYIEGVNTFAFALGNNVVLSLIDTEYYYGIYSNTIGNNSFLNTIGDGFNRNTINKSFHNNIIRNTCESNIIGNFFCDNTIGNQFNENTIGSYFQSNTISNKFLGNMIGNAFSGKTISTDTYNRNYGNDGVELATKNDLN